MRYLSNRNYGCRIWEFIFHGLQTVVLENELLRVSFLVDQGADIYEFLHKPSDTDFMWRSWLGIRDSSHVILTNPAQHGSFLDYYHGGWQELFPNADEPCTFKGADLGTHGEVCLMPWDYQILLNEPEEVAVKFEVRTYRTPFFLTRTCRLYSGKPFLEIEETVENQSNESVEFMWGHHPALGAPFLDEHCRIELPRCRIRSDMLLGSPFSRIAPDQDVEWPFIHNMDGTIIDLRKVPSEEIRCNDRVSLFDFEEGWYAVTNQQKKIGFGIAWEKEIFPFLLYWQSFAGWKGYPFYSNAYTLALEPRSSFPFPLTRAVEHNTHKTLDPHQAISTRLVAVAYSVEDEIEGISITGEVH